MPQPIKLFVIDDHEEVREALVVRLCAAPDMFVVGEAGATEAALEEVKALQPDVVLIETKCANGRRLEFVSRIARENSRTRVIALTSYPSEWERWATRRAGAVGYFLKDLGPAQLLEQIRNTVILNPPGTKISFPSHFFS
jgi:DNA-binding NarL/FixJ family response regulator